MPSEDLVPFSDLADSHPLTLNGDDTLIAVAQPDTSTETGYVSQTTTPNQLGAYIIQSQTHAGLKTQSKIVENAINSLVDDLTNINITGSTNDTGSTINSGIFFYLNGVLVRAITAIADGDTLTSGTNYEAVTAGGLNALFTSLTTAINTKTTGTLQGTVAGFDAWSNNTNANFSIRTNNNTLFVFSMNNSGTITGQYIPPT